LLTRAESRLSAGQSRAALSDFDHVARARAATPAERVAALTGGALAAEKLGDAPGARRRLERAVELDVAGASEPALFYLAERLRAENRGRALNLYYRAAAGAEKHRGSTFPYREAMERIVQMSMTGPP
jgi:hypothetical protein